MKLLTFLTVFFGLSMFVSAQTGLITGKVTTETGVPLDQVNILVKGENAGVATNADGDFTLSNVPTGKQYLILSSIGYRTVEKEIMVKADETVSIDIVLYTDVEQLVAIEIIESNGYKNTNTYVGSKAPSRIQDIPQAISYVTKEVFTDQQAFKMIDVVKNISGVNQFTWYEDFTMRGFRDSDIYVDGLRVVGHRPLVLLANVERVEVLKGPASAMFGNANPGGTMNRITKKPRTIRDNNFSVTTGSFNTLRTAIDLTGPLNEKRNVLYRLNLGYEETSTFRDLQENNSYIIAPSLSFLPTNKTRINFDLVVQGYDGKLDKGQPTHHPDIMAIDDPDNTPISLSLSGINDYHRNDVSYGTLSLRHHFTENISFNSSFMRFFYKEELLEHQPGSVWAVDGAGDEIFTKLAMRVQVRQVQEILDNVSNYFVIKANTGAMEHKFVVGVDYAQHERVAGSYAGQTSKKNIYLKTDGSYAKYKASDIEKFVLDSDGNPTPLVAHFDLADPLANFGLRYDSDYTQYLSPNSKFNPAKYKTTGFYIQDQIKWNAFQLLLGIRYNKYLDVENFARGTETEVEQTKLLPRVGLVYGVTKTINLYGTYTTSFEPQAVGNLDESLGGPFDPQEADMIEGGIKAEFFNNSLQFNLAIYNINKKNELLEDPNDSDKFISSGETTSKGFEIDVLGRIGSNFSVIFNYAYNETVFASGSSDNVFEEGDVLPNAPKHQGGLFMNYKLNTGKLSGFGINGGFNFVSERNSRAGVAEKLPAYTVLDAGLTYGVKDLIFRFTLNNVLDEVHWVGGNSSFRLFPGAPRSFLFGIGYSF